MSESHGTVLAMAEAARWAPSVHNTQPWRFRTLSNGLAIEVDPARALPALDPDGRLRSISCGAAVTNASVAAIAAGNSTRVTLLPEGPRSLVIAHVVPVAGRTPSVADMRRAAAIRSRRTHRLLYQREAVPTELLDDLAEAVADEGATLTVLPVASRRVLARVVARAVHEQEQRTELIAETRSWLRVPTHHAADAPVDGIYVGSLVASPHAGGAPHHHEPVIHDSGLSGRASEAVVVEELEQSSIVAVSTLTDTRRDRIVAGMAMQRLLLEAATMDVVAVWADQATQQPDTREQVSALLSRPGHAQVVLRLGRALVDVRVPPRRPLADLLDSRPTTVDLNTLPERARSGSGGLGQERPPRR